MELNSPFGDAMLPATLTQPLAFSLLPFFSVQPKFEHNPQKTQI